MSGMSHFGGQRWRWMPLLWFYRAWVRRNMDNSVRALYRPLASWSESRNRIVTPGDFQNAKEVLVMCETFDEGGSHIRVLSIEKRCRRYRAASRCVLIALSWRRDTLDGQARKTMQIWWMLEARVHRPLRSARQDRRRRNPGMRRIAT